MRLMTLNVAPMTLKDGGDRRHLPPPGTLVAMTRTENRVGRGSCHVGMNTQSDHPGFRSVAFVGSYIQILGHKPG